MKSSDIYTSPGFYTSTPTFDGRRHPRLKEGQFQYKYGHRHHSFDSEKAPYPLSYDRHILEIESLDNRLAQHLRGSVSFVNFIEGPPQRTLDLGCGTGTWIIEAAKQWLACEFVGFDLVNIQIPLKMLDDSIARRIEWRHGNFLTTKLPFEDDEFDHVHIQAIAKGVPENKWGVLFEEVNRVLRPGGSVEIIEDDVMFPLLPRWFTSALRSQARRDTSVHYPDGSRRSYPSPPNTPQNIPAHDHALLESLNKSVFEHRFINLKPTAVLPSYFTTYFRQVTLGPVINFPMPPIPSPQPLPPQTISSYSVGLDADISDSRPSTSCLQPMINRPNSSSFSSTISASTTLTIGSIDSSVFSERPRTTSASFSSTFEVGDTSAKPRPFNRFLLDGSLSESEIAALPRSLFPLEQLEALSERSLAMHLYRSYQSILACQEAMWEELKDRIINRKEELIPYGWDDDEELEELKNRKKFERLLERYKSDMQARISLWCSLTGIGWEFPARESLSKAELMEEERIRESLLEARRFVSDDERQVPCRSLRVLVGHKL